VVVVPRRANSAFSVGKLTQTHLATRAESLQQLDAETVTSGRLIQSAGLDGSLTLHYSGNIKIFLKIIGPSRRAAGRLHLRFLGGLLFGSV